MKSCYIITILMACIIVFVGCSNQSDHQSLDMSSITAIPDNPDTLNTEYLDSEDKITTFFTKDFQAIYLGRKKFRQKIRNEKTTFEIFRPFLMNNSEKFDHAEWYHDEEFYVYYFNRVNKNDVLEISEISIDSTPVEKTGDVLSDFCPPEINHNNLKEGEEIIEKDNNCIYTTKLYHYKNIDYFVFFTHSLTLSENSYQNICTLEFLLDNKYKVKIVCNGGNSDILADEMINKIIDSVSFEKLTDITIEPYDFSSREDSSEEVVVPNPDSKPESEVITSR